ncbi:YlmC/YmxH family sporulation protein [Pontibacillus sp. HMF3514]|uniref:YlmC/YmxH family sporulation protein n=1 Tax=Pontibacillus sp. HMF3514 TaxID=2692425 RepID=UPI00131FEBC6|nr:YlmC/YmxH family sporulation protein [Pontibacillus sp. HMF3514]QHE52240.1 YlmC/YmxH family sporulation protein [Pontibacillus sp. HMF3514]
MRYRDLSGKEIVDVRQGARLGVLGQTDLEIDPVSGKIKSFLVPSYKWFGMKKEGEEVRIYWRDIKKIGDDMIIIDPPDH